MDSVQGWFFLALTGPPHMTGQVFRDNTGVNRVARSGPSDTE